LRTLKKGQRLHSHSDRVRRTFHAALTGKCHKNENVSSEKSPRQVINAGIKPIELRRNGVEKGQSQGVISSCSTDNHSPSHAAISGRSSYGRLKPFSLIFIRCSLVGH